MYPRLPNGCSPCMPPLCRNCLNITRFWHISPVATPIPAVNEANKYYIQFTVNTVVEEELPPGGGDLM